MTAERLSDLLAAPLSPDWTIERLAEQLLCAIASQPKGETKSVQFDLSCPRTDNHSVFSGHCSPALQPSQQPKPEFNRRLYGGQLCFKRNGPDGPVWILGEFESKPGTQRVESSAIRLAAVSPRTESKSPVRLTRAGENRSLSFGTRGLPGGSSLAQLLDRERGVRNRSGVRRRGDKTVIELYNMILLVSVAAGNGAPRSLIRSDEARRMLDGAVKWPSYHPLSQRTWSIFTTTPMPKRALRFTFVPKSIQQARADGEPPQPVPQYIVSVQGYWGPNGIQLD